jgi:hypothetical protein
MINLEKAKLKDEILSETVQAYINSKIDTEISLRSELLDQWIEVLKVSYD